MSGPAAGGGRWVEVPPGRLTRWLENFAARHGFVATAADGALLTLIAADGTRAELHPAPGAPATDNLADFVAAAVEPRAIGLLLARRGAVAVGIAVGEKLTVSKVDTHYVQGRTAAGGWSQQRFARRRGNQAKAAAADSGDIAVRLLLPEVARLTAVVAGGDRGMIDTILADRRLAPVAALRAPRLLDVREPRHAVLVAAVEAARAVRIRVIDPVTQ